MHLVPNWDRVLKHAWSIQLAALNALVGYAAYALPYLQDYVSPKSFLAIMASLAVATIVVRLIPQRKISDGHDQD